MGIFDFIKKGEDGSNSSNLRVSWNETEDIEIVTHYKGKPFTGICYSLHDNENLNDEHEMLNGLKHGCGKYYYENGIIKAEANYINDKLNGSYKSFDENGLIFLDVEYINGLRDGMMTEYYKDGKIKMQLKYSKDKLINITGYFDCQGNNNLENQECIKYDLLEEKDKVLYLDNKPYNGLSLDDSKPLGITIDLYKDGIKIEEKLFWRNGVLRSDSNIEEGYKVENRYQMEDGRLLREIKNGYKLSYHDDGYLEKEENIETGEIKTFYESGKIRSINPHVFGEPKNKENESHKSFFETGELKQNTFAYNDIDIYEEYHKNGAIYNISAFSSGKIELYFDEEGIEITQLNEIPNIMKNTEEVLRKKYKLKDPQTYKGKLFFNIQQSKFFREEIEDGVENDKDNYCVFCKVAIFYNESEYEIFKSRNLTIADFYGEFYVDNKGKYCEFDYVTKIVDVNHFLEFTMFQKEIEEKVSFYGDEEGFISFIKEKFGNDININLIENGKLVKSPGHESNFTLGELTFKYEYEKVRRVIEDLIGGEITEIDNDEFEIYASPSASEQIIENLFPGKYITVCRYVYYGDFEYNGNEESDIVHYCADGEELNYVGGEYNEDINKSISREMFYELEEKYTIEHEPKYESFEVIVKEEFKSLEDYIKKRFAKKENSN